MKYKQSRIILLAQSAEESVAGKSKAKSLQQNELNNLLQDQQLLSGSREIRGSSKQNFEKERLENSQRV